MKYILTKDGIYEVVKEDDDEWVDIISNFEGKMKCQCCIKKKGILKQADTIEELCDAFVDTSELKTTNTGGWLYDEFNSDNKCLVYYEQDERKTIPLNEFDDLSKIRGAIWTDKGLIYVAKMNEKGELETL